MDYSLLCGVHYPRRDDGSASLPPQSPPAPDGATPLSPPAVIREESSDHRPAPASPDVVAEAARASRASYAANYAAAPAPAPSRSGSGNGGSGDGSAGQLRSGSPVLRPSTAGAMPPLRPLGEKGIALPKPPWVDHWDGAIDGDVEAGAEPELYFIGIIDILTSWSAAKSAENFVKMVAHPTEGSSGISCVPPDTYASRFLSKLQRWIH